MSFVSQLFAEDVTPLLWLIGLVELVLVILLKGTGRLRLLLPMALLAGLAAVLWGVEWAWVTDRERVDGIIQDMAQSVRQKDVAQLVHHLAPDCRYGEFDRAGIERVAEAAFDAVQLDRVKVSQRSIEMFPMRREARAEFRAVVTGRQSGAAFNSYPTRWLLRFRQAEDGAWQVTDISQVPLLGEDRQPLPPVRVGR